MNRGNREDVAIDVGPRTRERSASESRTEYDRRQSLAHVTRY
jgi:hypothetical protein